MPAELTKAALRRAWTTDPAIRDFIGIAENQWDFTDPTAMPGFGPLEATDDVRKLVAQAMGKLGKVSEPSSRRRYRRAAPGIGQCMRLERTAIRSYRKPLACQRKGCSLTMSRWLTPFSRMREADQLCCGATCARSVRRSCGSFPIVDRTEGLCPSRSATA